MTMRRIFSFLLPAAAGVTLFLGAATLGDARADDDGATELALPDRTGAGAPASLPEATPAAVSAPDDVADQGDVEPDGITFGPVQAGSVEVVAPASVAEERATMLDPERLATIADSGAEPYEPPAEEDALPLADVRAALDGAAGSEGLPSGDSLGITPIGDDGGTVTRFFDLCAGTGEGSEPADGEGCPEEGVGGTILFGLGFAIDVPPPFRYGVAEINRPSWMHRCPVEQIDFRTEAHLWHTANRPADRVTVRYGAPGGPDDGRLEVTSVPAPGEQERDEARSDEQRAAGDPADGVHYCTVLKDLDPDAVGVSVEIEYEVDGRTFTNRFRTARTRESQTRPALTLSPAGDHAIATMTHTRAERAYLAAIPRAGAGATQDRCADIRQAVLDRTYRGSAIVARPTLMTVEPPITSSFGDEYDRRTIVGVWPEEGVTYTLCAWFVGTDEVGVTDAVDQHELQFTAPNRWRVKVTMLSYEAVRETAADQLSFLLDWPDAPEVVLPGRRLEDGEVYVFADGEAVIDSGASVIPEVSTYRFLNADGADGSRWRSTIPTGTDRCPIARPGQDESELHCWGDWGFQTGFAVGARGSDEPLGWLNARIDYYDGPGAEHRELGQVRDWNIGPTATGNTQGGDPDTIHLLTTGPVGGTATRVEIAPDDPSSIEVVLVGDREFAVDQVHLDTVAIDEGGCDAPAQASAAPAASHTFRFGGLCPGTTYRVDYTLSSATSGSQSGRFGRVATTGTRVESITYRHSFTPEPGVGTTSWNAGSVYINGWTAPLLSGGCEPAGGFAGRETRGWSTRLEPETVLPRLVPVAVTVRPDPDTADCDEARPRAAVLRMVPAADLLAGDVTIDVPVAGWGTVHVRVIVTPVPQLGEPPVAP